MNATSTNAATVNAATDTLPRPAEAPRAEAPRLQAATRLRDGHWDPFEGRVARRRDAFTPLVIPWSPYARRVAWVAAFGVPVLIAGGVAGAMEWGWWETVLVPLGFLLVLGGGMHLAFVTPAAPEDGNDPVPDRLRRAVVALAGRHGWSVRLVEPSRQAHIPLERHRAAPTIAETAEAIPCYPGRPDKPLGPRQHADLAHAARERDLGGDRNRRSAVVHDPAVHAAYMEIVPLLKHSIVAARPTLFHAVVHREIDGVPLWTGLAMQGHDARNPRRVSERAVGQTQDRGGRTLVLVHALPLDGADQELSATFRTRRRDVLAPDPTLALGGRFDDAFTVKLLSGDARSLPSAVPAQLRTTLTYLHRNDDAEAMIHRGALFVRTITILPGGTRAEAQLEASIEAALARIGGALVEGTGGLSSVRPRT